MPLPASSANLAQQQRDYQSVVQQCNAVAGCIGVTIWDFTDKVSPWLVSIYYLLDAEKNMFSTRGYPTPSAVRVLPCHGTR